MNQTVFGVPVLRPATLREWLLHLVRTGSTNTPESFRMVKDQVRHDCGMLMELIGEEHFEELMLNLLRECSQQVRTGGDQGLDVDKTLSPPARPHLNVRRAHVVKAPGPRAPYLSGEKLLEVRTQSAIRTLLDIDGVSLLEWTVGQCRTAARKRRDCATGLELQARMLEAVIARVGTSLADTDKVGKVLTGEDLEQLANQISAE